MSRGDRKAIIVRDRPDLSLSWTRGGQARLMPVAGELDAGRPGAARDHL